MAVPQAGRVVNACGHLGVLCVKPHDARCAKRFEWWESQCRPDCGGTRDKSKTKQTEGNENESKQMDNGSGYSRTRQYPGNGVSRGKDEPGLDGPLVHHH